MGAQPATQLPLLRCKVLVAPDKFKGTLTSREAADAIAAEARALGAVTRVQPIADGGDGTVDAFGGTNRHSMVTGPLGSPVRAGWRLEGGRAVIESAAASGLVLAGGPAGNGPWAATSAGTGELIAEALVAGATEIVVGMGGSAMTDGGVGALTALAGHVPFPAGRVQVLTDVTTPFSQAAAVFGPQKGADEALVARLTRRLRAVAHELLARFDVDVWDLPRAGAAGGLAGGLAAAGASLSDGARVVADRVSLREHIQWADLVVTGEGRFDATSLAGKGPGLVVEQARARHRPVLVLAGDAEPGLDIDALLVSLVDTVGADAATSNAAVSLALTAQAGFRTFY